MSNILPHYEITVSKGTTFYEQSYDTCIKPEQSVLIDNSVNQQTTNSSGLYDINNGFFTFNSYDTNTLLLHHDTNVLNIKKIILKNTFTFGTVQYDYVFISSSGALFWLPDSYDINNLPTDFPSADIPMISFLGHSVNMVSGGAINHPENDYHSSVSANQPKIYWKITDNTFVFHIENHTPCWDKIESHPNGNTSLTYFLNGQVTLFLDNHPNNPSQFKFEYGDMAHYGRLAKNGKWFPAEDFPTYSISSIGFNYLNGVKGDYNFILNMSQDWFNIFDNKKTTDMYNDMFNTSDINSEIYSTSQVIYPNTCNMKSNALARYKNNGYSINNYTVEGETPHPIWPFANFDFLSNKTITFTPHNFKNFFEFQSLTHNNLSPVIGKVMGYQYSVVNNPLYSYITRSEQYNIINTRNFSDFSQLDSYGIAQVIPIHDNTFTFGYQKYKYLIIQEMGLIEFSNLPYSNNHISRNSNIEDIFNN